VSRPPGVEAPGRDCPLCARLANFRTDQRAAYPDWFNAPVPAFGGMEGRLLVVGLAPGLRGANRTGRPFTGDYAGDLLYATLAKFGFARGDYAQRADDGLALIDCRVTNAVRCVPPENKPEPAEIKSCNRFLAAELKQLPRLKVVLALGAIAHQAVLAALRERRAAFPFAHGAMHALTGGLLTGELLLADSYHCSRYNTNTRVLTTAMFEAVFAEVRRRLDQG
jgi:uracil-DNA glycosylase family 4